jgi:NADPH2:quinone reductase
VRSVQAPTLDGPSSVVIQTTDEPTLIAGEVLVDVHAVAVSFPDLLMSKGKYQLQPELPITLGGDLAGVVRVAPAGSGFTAGDRVAGFLDYGAGADVVSVPTARVYPLPGELTFAEGAALPLNYLTAHFALTLRGGLRSGETVLVHGAAGGVGIAAIQVAKALGARVIAVASSPAKREACIAAGADEAIDVVGFRDAARTLTDQRGVDIVVDVVGGDIMTDSLRSLAPLGRVLVIGFASGAIPEVKVNRLLLNNTDIRGVEWGYMLDRDLTAGQWSELMKLAETGAIRPLIESIRPLEEFADGLRAMEAREVLGRRVFALR